MKTALSGRKYLFLQWTVPIRRAQLPLLSACSHSDMLLLTAEAVVFTWGMLPEDWALYIPASRQEDV